VTMKEIKGNCPQCGIHVSTETSPRTWVASACFGLFCCNEHYQEFMRNLGVFREFTPKKVE